MTAIDEARQAFDRGECARAEEICTQLVSKEASNAAAWHLLGLARRKLGRREPAVDALTKATNLDRRAAPYHYELGNALLDDGKIDRAISAFRRALRIDDTLAEAHNDLGAAYFQKGWHAEAEQCFRKAIEHKPEHGIAHANLGAALRGQGRLSEGRRAYQRALVLRLRAMLPSFLRWQVRQPSAPAPAPAADEVRQALKPLADALTRHDIAEAVVLARKLESRYPEEPDVLLMAAVAFEEAKDIPAALSRTRAAIERKPDRAEYRIVLARLQVKSGEHNAALETALAALKLEPGSADVHATIAGICHPWRDDIAEEAARRAVEIDAASHAGHGNLAAALWGLGRLEEAERHALEAIRLKPGYIPYRSNLALICKDQGRIDEARAIYHELIAESPDHPKLAMDLGTLAVECEGDVAAARRWYRKAHALSGEPRSVLSEALLDLAEGNYAAGWDRYEARKQVADQRYQHSLFSAFPQWDGSPLTTGRLLVYGEQGLGDEIMFASQFADLAKHVSQRSAQVSVMCDARLGALFARSFPAFEVIAEPRASQEQRAKSLQNIEAAIGAGSLGRLYRKARADFPRHGGYLTADPAKTAAWKQRLDALGPGRKMGLSWMGGLQKTGRSRRSLTPEQLQPLLATPGIHWISLQHPSGTADAKMTEFPGVTADLDDLASLVAALDLVISVCNTTVHIAGALGMRVLVMAPFTPEWRYGLSGEDMVWYPSARVFRQSRYGVWDDVLAKVLESVRTL